MEHRHFNARDETEQGDKTQDLRSFILILIGKNCHDYGSSSKF